VSVPPNKAINPTFAEEVIVGNIAMQGDAPNGVI
jgi:hypothetical protein